MSDAVRIRLFVDTGFAGATHEDEIEIPRDEWEQMDEEVRNDFLTEQLDGLVWNSINTWYEVVDDEDDE